MRLNVNTAERDVSTADMFGGSIRYVHRFDNGTEINLYTEHLSTKGPADSVDFAAFVRSSAFYAGIRHGPVSGRVGYDRGAFQAAMQAELNRRLFHLRAEARVSVTPDGNYAVFFGVQGHF